MARPKLSWHTGGSVSYSLRPKSRASKQASGLVCSGGRELLGQLDARAPRVGQVGDLGRPIRSQADGLVELNALRFELLCKRFQVLHIEADVIERPPFGRRQGRLALREGKVRARDVVAIDPS